MKSRDLIEALFGAVYDPLRIDPRVIRSVRRAHASIGIGNPIRDLTVTTLDNNEKHLKALVSSE